jgi:hypothetical protein
MLIGVIDMPERKKNFAIIITALITIKTIVLLTFETFQR